ncbi:MAG: diacylglycerol kinase family protein [Patescibacteria group bacterium]
MGYFYLYDNFLQDRAYATQLIRLENILTDLSLQGRVGRLSLLKSIRDLISGAVRDGASTLVAVGNDDTLSRLIEVAADFKKITVGFIPLGTKNQTLAKLLGIPLGILACQTLSNRLIQTIDLGKINGQFWWQKIEGVGEFKITIDQKSQITLTGKQNIVIGNFGDLILNDNNFLFNPQDNLLEIIASYQSTKKWWKKSATNSLSILPAKNLKLTALGDNILLKVDSFKTVKTPAIIAIAPEKIRLIVGKKRIF